MSTRRRDFLKTATTGTSQLGAYIVTWNQALNSQEQLMPPRLTLGPLPTPSVAVPGQTPLV